jgi:hypothetical protein
VYPPNKSVNEPNPNNNHGVVAIELRNHKSRAIISLAKLPLLSAIIRIVETNSSYWPLSVRQIHYRLLNDPPLCHADKPDSYYANTQQFYKNQCVDICARARLAGYIPWEAISDETRPTDLPWVFTDWKKFVRNEMERFLDGYRRDLVQSQPNHIEIVVEKNTVYGILRPIAQEFCLPITSGRGYCSLAPRHDLVERFRVSNKIQLIVLLLSDFDPDGEEISHSFARSLRDDFGLTEVRAIKAGITQAQVRQFNLAPIMTAKTTSARYGRFIETHQSDVVHELEALEPGALSELLRIVIGQVLDWEKFNQEREQEESDHARIGQKRELISAMLEGELDP